MRMWMIDPSKLCRKHLLGEHLECTMFVGTINKGISIKGYLNGGLLQVDKLKERHDQLAEEMVRRGYKHKSPLPDFKYEGENGSVDSAANEIELHNRCKDCQF